MPGLPTLPPYFKHYICIITIYNITNMYDIVYTRIYVMKMGGKVGNPGRI